MRDLLVLLTIVSILLGHSVIERPAGVSGDHAALSDDGAAQVPSLTAEPTEAGPLFYRKTDGSSSSDGPISVGGSLPAERVNSRSVRGFVLGAAAALPTASLLPALHLRI